MRILRKLFIPLALAFYMLRYRTIWRVREKMREKCLKGGKVNAKKLIWDAYGHYFDKRCGFVGQLTEFDGEPCFPHGPFGVFISNDARIGHDAVIFQNVTIGSNTIEGSSKPGAPTIGDRVYIGANAVIVGGVIIGDGCRIGAGAVVYSDMTPNSVAVSAPTRIIEREEPMDNRYRQHLPNGAVRIFENGVYHIVK